MMIIIYPMKVTRDQAAQNRQRIVDVASRAFRARGLEGIGVSDIMDAAGLTHGGFYGNFESKAALQVEACKAALHPAAARWQAVIDESPDDALASIADGYLSERHRDSPAAGCAFAALSPEISRAGPELKAVATEGLRARIDLLSRAVEAPSAKARRKKAIATLAALVGAVVLARVTDEAGLSDEILEAVRSELA